MANTQGICDSFKAEVMLGNHQLGAVTLVSRTSLTAPTTDTVKAALFFASATLSRTTTVYSTTGEATGTGYTAGGITVTNATAPTTNGGSGVWTPSASLAFGVVSIAAFDTVLFYNSTQSNKAIAVYTFGSQTVVAASFTITMPANTTGVAAITLA